MAMSILCKNQVDLSTTETHRTCKQSVGYCAHFAEVLVDIYTGKVKIVDYVAVHDVGKALNPGIVKGQVEGGVQMGIGYALYEEIRISREGIPLDDSFKKYHLVNAPDMPEVRLFLIEEEEPGGPFGAKSIGEITVVPVAPAIVNAVNNALGTEFAKIPVTPAIIMEELARREMSLYAAGI